MNINVALPTTCHDIEQFLFLEARLLDEGRFKEWLNLLTEDIRYWMPSMARKYRSVSHSITLLDPASYEEREFTTDHELSILDETKESLVKRVARLDTGMAWAEDPPSSTCHIISNISIRETQKASELSVHSNFILYRSRGEHEQDFFVGRRDDVLRFADEGWKLASRKIIVPQNVLSAKNASNFF